MLDAPKSKPKDLEAIARTGGPLRRMAARIPTYLTDLRENPAWLPMFLLARTMRFRRAHWLTAKPVKTLKTASSMFGEIKADDVAAELKKTGIFTGLTLPDTVQKEIARFARETPCFGNFERKLEFLAEEHDEALRSRVRNGSTEAVARTAAMEKRQEGPAIGASCADCGAYRASRNQQPVERTPIIGSRGATMRELASGAAAVEGGMGEGPCLVGTEATSLARSLRLSHERSGASGRDCRWQMRNAILRCSISPSTASYGVATLSPSPSETLPFPVACVIGR